MRRLVYRSKPLPRGLIRGRYLIAEPVINATRDALIGFGLDGIDDAGHEGMAFWAGRQCGDDTLLLQAIVPQAEHTHGSVIADRNSVSQAARTARAQGLGLLVQVHSHPGTDARHSDGDDHLVLLPFEDMLSVVAPQFGLPFRALGDVCVHQFQDGRWVLCSAESVASRLILIPSTIDLR